MVKVLNELLRVGDKVLLQMGGRELQATIIEDRGLIGIEKRQLVRVETSVDEVRLELELPSNQLKGYPLQIKIKL